MILNAGVWKDAVADCKTHYSVSTNQLEKACKPVVLSDTDIVLPVVSSVLDRLLSQPFSHFPGRPVGEHTIIKTPVTVTVLNCDSFIVARNINGIFVEKSLNPLHHMRLIK